LADRSLERIKFYNTESGCCVERVFVTEGKRLVQKQTGIELEIQWTRLVAIADEVGASLQRTCFSTIVREGYDFAVVLMDSSGNSIAQSSLSIPSFIGTLPITCRKVIEKFSVEGFGLGDVIITNDPWTGTGHLPDLTVIKPVFLGGQLVAFAGNIIHLPDIGGGRMAANATEIYQEGLRIPISKLVENGRVNPLLVNMIRANVRVADYVMADIQSQLTANELAARKLVNFMEEYSLSDISELAVILQSISERAMRDEIRKIPNGKYRYSLLGDGYDETIIIKVCVEIQDEDIVIDYEGTAPQSQWGINSVYGYTYAYTVYPLKCVLDPETPNNEGCFRPIKVRAPEGSLLNPDFPAAVNARHQTGHLLQAAIFGALADVIPERIQGDSGLGWVIALQGHDQDGRPHATAIFLSGGQGARAAKDGINTLVYPANTSNTSIEVLESELPVRYEEKSFIQDSGGAGRTRGGCGQRVKLRCTSEEHPLILTLMTDRIVNPPLGFGGGLNGRAGAVSCNISGSVAHKGKISLNAGDTLVLDLPGGGGLGPPSARDPERIKNDITAGFVSLEKAQSDYGLSVEAVEILLKT